MTGNWTVGQKIGAGFAAIVALAIVTGVVASVALTRVVDAKDDVIRRTSELLVNAETLRATIDRNISAVRGYLLAPDERFLSVISATGAEFAELITRVRGAIRSEEGRHLVAAVEEAQAHYAATTGQMIDLRRSDAGEEVIARAFEDRLAPQAEVLRASIDAFKEYARVVLEEGRAQASTMASLATGLVAGIAALAVVFAAALAVALTRGLTAQIGTIVSQVRSSSAELQTAANQQATGAREQATAMSEITTTITELLATSRQIAGSAQRVAHIAVDVANAASSGEGTVGKAHESIAAIRQQMDQLVGYMLDLGNKSQQIGAVVDIVSELAEQTNILAINATIEAAGAGEAGTRFAVVADEIRKLADRVGGSAKEIRGLIEDIRSAVNTSIMATESGSKAVDSGLRHFSDVAAAFKQIAEQVRTTADAAREIELSTQQQATAVEQVNVAIASVAQATRETEASTAQTHQTASELASLSQVLMRLIRPPAATGA